MMDEHALRSMGDEAIGVVSALLWSPTLTNPANQTFMKLAEAKRASETTEDPRGPIKLDDYGNPTENVYILKVERVGGKLVNTVLHTYPLVSQFWTYSATDFLKLPAYTRDYPPAKP